MSPRRVVIRNHSAEANLFARRTFIAFAGVVAILLVDATLFKSLFGFGLESETSQPMIL